MHTPPDSNPPDPAPTTEVERGRRLSDSLIWRLQRSFFAHAGVEAWRRGTVPHYITTNPAIAAAYARLVFGFLRDCFPQAGGLHPLDPSAPPAPIWIVELGAGSGRFTFLFLNVLRRLLDRSALRSLPFTYVITDVVQPNLDFCRTHPWLQPFVHAGLLDFAIFDLTAPGPLQLLHSGAAITPDRPAGALVALANYVFDSLPQDVFAIRAGQLAEGLVTLTSPQPEPDLDDPTLLTRLNIAYHYNPSSCAYETEAELNQVIAEYQHGLDDAVILFPCAALRGIGGLAQLSAGPLLLLSGDKGYTRLDQVANRSEPRMALHGCVSMMVNYHAIGRYVELKGGQVWHPLLATSLSISAMLLGQPAGGTTETALAYDEAIVQRSPDDLFTLKKAIEPHYAELTPEQLFAYLRLSGWDANIFIACFPALFAGLEHADAARRETWRAALGQVWAAYYPIGEEHDLAFHIGLLLYRLGAYADALEYLERSLQLYGPDTSTLYNMALCSMCLNQPAAALKWLDQALAVNPTFAPAVELRAKLGPWVS